MILVGSFSFFSIAMRGSSGVLGIDMSIGKVETGC